MALFLGIDVGTQSVKALIYDAELDEVLARSSVPLDVQTPRPGAMEQDPRAWLDAAEGSVAQVLADPAVEPGDVQGIGVSGQQHGFVALDAAGKVIRPAKLWCDMETAPEAEELSQAWGRPVPAGYTASKVLWLKQHEPEQFSRLDRALLPHDYCNLYLTGRAATDAGDASGTGYFDPEKRAYDESAASHIDSKLPGCLPELLEPAEVAGELRKEVADRLGLPQGVKVSAGSGDNMMSALGAGSVVEGVLTASLGTSGTLFAHSPKPVLDPSGVIAPFCDATGGWLPLLCTMNCTTVLEEVSQAFDESLSKLTARAEDEPAGCEGLAFLPYLAGERAPNWPHASGTLLGMRAGSMRAGLVFRAAMEGATFALLHGFERMQELGVTANEIRVVGGGSHNELWVQLIADTFGVPVSVPNEAETAALGAALQATAACTADDIATVAHNHGMTRTARFIQPRGSQAKALRGAFERYSEAARRLFEI